MSRPLSCAALVLGLAAALLGPAVPASAVTDPGLNVFLNKPFTYKGGPITGVSTVYQANWQAGTELPSNCAGEPAGCEVVPLNLQIPQSNPDDIVAAGYILTVKLDWDPGTTASNLPVLGSEHSDQIEGDLWQNPPIVNSSGSPSYSTSSNGSEPANDVVVNLSSKKFDMVVANFLGNNTGYTLSISLTNAASLTFDPSKYGQGSVGTPTTYVQPRGLPPMSPQASGFGGATGPGLSAPAAPTTTVTAPFVATGPTPIIVPNIADGTADPALLAMGDTSLRSGLGLHAVTVSSTVAGTVVAHSSTLAITLGMLALPVLGAIGLLLLLRRRRTARPSTTVALA